MSDSQVPVNASIPAPAVPSTENLTVENKETKPVVNTDGFASKFAALTRKERDFKAQMAAKESEWATKQAEIAEKQKKYMSYETLDTELSTDKRKALEFLQSKGITLDELSNLLVDELNPNEEVKFKRMQTESERALRKEIEALKLQFEEKENKKKESEEQSAKEQHEKVVQKVLADVTEFVNGNDEYELIRSYNSVETVYELMSQHYQKQVDAGTPDQLIKILTYKEACDAVESHLEQQVTKVYEAKRSKQAPKENKQEPTKTSPTLSNTLSSEVPVSGEKQMSNEESLKRAAAMLRFNVD